jgi:hypothetical protein
MDLTKFIPLSTPCIPRKIPYEIQHSLLQGGLKHCWKLPLVGISWSRFHLGAFDARLSE